MALDRCPTCGNKFVKPKEPTTWDQFCPNCLDLIYLGACSPKEKDNDATT